MNTKNNERGCTIIRYNIAGILLNLLLSVAKLIIGIMIKSRAVMLDAVNGFSDIVSSFVSMLSTLYVGKRADLKHPFGYGRLEYISSLFTTGFIVFMGLHAAYDAIKEIIGPGSSASPNYNMAVVVLMAVSVVAKIVYGLKCRKTGRELNATSLIMSGTETIGDCVVSFSILLTIAIYHATGLNLEPWLSILISLFLIQTGFEMARECINKLLGTKSAPAIYKALKKMIADEPEVMNVFNLILQNYGEELIIGSVDIEVDEYMTAAETTKLVRKIIRRVSEAGVRLSSVGIYGSNLRDGQNAAMWDQVLKTVCSHPEFMRAYAFSYDASERTAFFVVVLDPSLVNKDHSVSELVTELESLYPGISFTVESALEI